MKRSRAGRLFLFGWLFTLAACQSMPSDVLSLSQKSFVDRNLQTRRFEGISESDALAAGAGVLQDLGFIITESEFSLGLVVGRKEREAGWAGKGIGFVFANGVLAPDVSQKFYASLVTRAVLDKDGQPVPRMFLVRVTFARTVWDSGGEVTMNEQLDDAVLYDGFFDRLSKSVFLVGQRL